MQSVCSQTKAREMSCIVLYILPVIYLLVLYSGYVKCAVHLKNKKKGKMSCHFLSSFSLRYTQSKNKQKKYHVTPKNSPTSCNFT